MKTALFALILVFAPFVAVSAQTNETLPCPSVEIIGPAGVTELNEPIVFTAKLGEGAEKFSLEYKWTVSGGTIIEGQGTSRVKALETENGMSLTLTFEIIGLPKGCEYIASETTVRCPAPEPELINEFSIVAPRINKAGLDNLTERLQKNPSAMAYIIEKFEKQTSRKTIEQKNQETLKYLKLYLNFRGIEDDRIVRINSYADKNLTQFYLVPAGATPPICDDCDEIK